MMYGSCLPSHPNLSPLHAGRSRRRRPLAPPPHSPSHTCGALKKPSLMPMELARHRPPLSIRGTMTRPTPSTRPPLAEPFSCWFGFTNDGCVVPSPSSGCFLSQTKSPTDIFYFNSSVPSHYVSLPQIFFFLPQISFKVWRDDIPFLFRIFLIDDFCFTFIEFL